MLDNNILPIFVYNTFSVVDIDIMWLWSWLRTIKEANK